MKSKIILALEAIERSWGSIPWVWRISESSHPSGRYNVSIYVNPNNVGEKLLAGADGSSLRIAYKILLQWMLEEGLKSKYEGMLAHNLIDGEMPENWPINRIHAQYLNSRDGLHG